MVSEAMMYSKNKTEMYEEVVLQIKGLLEDCPHVIANLANVSAVLNQAMKDINWVGFYVMEEGQLVLGPFQGKAACVEIKVGKGVCGTAVAEDAIQLVKDVHAFPGHIACDSASNSEIVLPIHAKGNVWGVLDIDSPLLGRFDEEDKDGLAKVVGVVEAMLEEYSK